MVLAFGCPCSYCCKNAVEFGGNGGGNGDGGTGTGERGQTGRNPAIPSLDLLSQFNEGEGFEPPDAERWDRSMAEGEGFEPPDAERWDRSMAEGEGFEPPDAERWDRSMAEGEGFEPPLPVKAKRFSRPPVSTAHTSLHC